MAGVGVGGAFLGSVVGVDVIDAVLVPGGVLWLAGNRNSRGRGGGRGTLSIS